MASRIMELAISIKGKLDQAYTDSMKRAISEAGNLQRRLQEMSQAAQGSQRLLQRMGELKGIQANILRFRELKRSVSDYTLQLAQAQANANKYAAELRRSQAATEQLRQRHEALAASLKELKGKIPNAEWRQMNAEAKALKATLKESEANTKAAGRAFEQAKNQAASLKSKLAEQQAELQRIRSSIAQAGYSAQNLAQNEARLRQEIQQTTRALEQASRAQEQANARREHQRANSQAVQDAYNAYGNFQGAIGTAQTIAQPFVGAIENAMTFEHAMSRVKALTQSGLIRQGDFDAVSVNMQKLEAQARELGATTQFTMTQAADAMGYLGMAGWKTEQIYGTMPGMLDLAVGAGTDLARTADIVSDNMTAMGIPVEKAGHFMDVYAYALTNAMNDDTRGAMIALDSATDAVVNALGTVFLPVVRQAAEALAPMATGMAKWLSENKEVAFALGAVAAALAAVIVIAAGVQLAFAGWGLIASTITLVTTSTTWLAIKTKLSAAATFLHAAANTALAASMNALRNPIATVTGLFAGMPAKLTAARTAIMGLPAMISGAFTALPGMISGAFAGIAAMGWPVVLAILAIVAVVALVAANFDKLKETATIVFHHISGTVGAWAATIQAKFAEALNKITEVWNSVTGQSLQSSELIGAIFNNLGFVLGAAFDIAAGIVGTAISVIMNHVASVAQIIGGIVNFIVGIFTGDWKKAWDGAGQAVEDFAGGTLGTLKTIAGGIGDVFDTLMGKADEVQKKAEQAKASQDVTASSRNALPQATADYLPNEGMLQTAQAAQQTAAATAEASANAQALSANVQQGGAAAQQTAGYMQQLQELMGQIPGTSQAAFAGMGEQSAVAAQSVSMNMQQIPQQAQAALQQIQPQAQAAFQQLPPHAQQGVDGIAQEVSQLAAKCQPGGDAFVQAANQWGQQAYESIANWSSQMAQVVVDRLSSAWAQISSQFSAGLNVNVTTSGAGVAANAEGGIYRKGAFLTTFAEKSPEAAIPLDGSNRAISLWQRAGELLGMLPKGTGNAASFDAPVLPDIQQVTAGLKDAHTTTLPPPVVETAQQAAPAVQAAVPAAAILPPAARPEAILRREAPPPMGGMFQAIRESASQAVSGLAQKGSLFLERLLPAQQAMGAEFPMAGALLPSLGDVAELAIPQENDWRADAPIAIEPPSGGGMHMHFEYHAPSITIQGNADSETASQIEHVLAKARSEWMREVERRFGGMLASHIHQQRRTSYAT